MKKAIVIRHVAFEDLGNLAPVLEQRGFALEYWEAGYHDLRKLQGQDPDLLVVLGGPISAYDEADFPFIHDELALLAARIQRGRPTLGICLGAQLIAKALGARVYPGGQKEIGWSELQLQKAGWHGFFEALQGIRVLHWHGDTFDLPPGAHLLASTDIYPHQAFSVGKACLALQFHPEVTTLGLERWFIGHSGEIANTPGLSVRGLRMATQKYAQALAERAPQFWGLWLDSLELAGRAE